MKNPAFVFLSLCFIGLWALMPRSFAAYTTPALQFEFKQQTIKYHLISPNLNNNSTGDVKYRPQETLGTAKMSAQKHPVPIILLLSGGPAFSSWNLQPIQQQLADWGYPTLLMDMAGVGENSGFQNTANESMIKVWREQIESLYQTIRTTDNRQTPHRHEEPIRFWIVGHSWGALMAMLVAQQSTLDIERMVFLNPVDAEKKSLQTLAEQLSRKQQSDIASSNREGGFDQSMQWDNSVNDAVNDELTAEQISQRQISQVLPYYFIDYQQGRDYAKQFSSKDFDALLNIQIWQEYERQKVNYPDIKNQAIRLDFIGCREDLLMPENLTELNNHLRFENIRILIGCNHFPWVEKPKAFYSALKQTLQAEP